MAASSRPARRGRVIALTPGRLEPAIRDWPAPGEDRTPYQWRRGADSDPDLAAELDARQALLDQLWSEDTTARGLRP